MLCFLCFAPKSNRGPEVQRKILVLALFKCYIYKYIYIYILTEEYVETSLGQAPFRSEQRVSAVACS